MNMERIVGIMAAELVKDIAKIDEKYAYESIMEIMTQFQTMKKENAKLKREIVVLKKKLGET